MANLIIVARNPEPEREKQYPRTWLVYATGRDTVEVHVEHDACTRPRVVEKTAA